MYFLWQDLSVDTKIFDFVTLTLTFDLLLKKLNLGNNFWTRRDRAFIFHMFISRDKTFLLETIFFTSWPWLLTYFWKKLNLDHKIWTKSDRALILHIFIPCDKTFLLIPIFLTSDLDLEFDLLMLKLELVAAGGISPVRTDPDLVMPRIEWSGAYYFCPVCLFVCLSVCLLSTLTFAITFEL